MLIYRPLDWHQLSLSSEIDSQALALNIANGVVARTRFAGGVLAARVTPEQERSE
tara:strand:+ start:35 stop:199 length:165 start_codon:yes stop_codon:yes gene_type:complete